MCVGVQVIYSSAVLYSALRLWFSTEWTLDCIQTWRCSQGRGGPRGRSYYIAQELSQDLNKGGQQEKNGWIDFFNLRYLGFDMTKRLRTRVNIVCSSVPLLKPMRKGSTDAFLIACSASFMASKNEHTTYPLWPAWWWQQQPTPCQLKVHTATPEVIHTVRDTHGGSAHIKLTFAR